MKFIKQDLLTLLIGLFLFASCKSTNSIGLDIDPENAIEGDLIDTLTIGSRTLAEDASQTYSNAAKGGLPRYPLGVLQDPLFGPSEASIAMAVNLPNESYGFGDTPLLDSAVLVMAYSSQFYGDTANSVYSVDVHQLDQNIATQTSFLSNKEYPASKLLANLTGKILPNTRLSITDIVSTAPDTAINVAPQMRIKLDPLFISEELLTLDSATLKYQERFTAFFKGLKVSIKKSASTGTGGIMYFDFNDTNSKLELYYRRKNATTPANTDTIHVDFPIRVASNPVASTLKRNYAGTPIETQLNNPGIQYPVTYLQGLGGLKNQITFPHISKLKTALGKVVVNKAELVIDLSSGTDVSPFIASPRLALYRYDIAERRQNIPDNDVASQANPTGDPRAYLSPQQFGGTYDPINKRYIFIVTFYVQDLLDGKKQDYGTFLSTTPTSEFSISPPVTAAARSVIGSFGNVSNKIKLNIYYTKIK
jgi:hypothetical protein